MEERIQYLERYKIWLRVQLGKAKTQDLKDEIQNNYIKASREINELLKK